MIVSSRLAQLVLVVGLSAPVLGACAGGEDTPPLAPAPSSSNSPLAGSSSTSSASSAGTPDTAVCTDKQVRECRVELSQQGAVKNCFVGLQLCTNGTWGRCLSADEVEAQLTGQ
jgi:hypothetical protein